MAPTPTPRKWRSDRRGDRATVLVRLSGDVAERLNQEAEKRHRSLAEAATPLTTAGLEPGTA